MVVDEGERDLVVKVNVRTNLAVALLRQDTRIGNTEIIVPFKFDNSSFLFLLVTVGVDF